MARNYLAEKATQQKISEQQHIGRKGKTAANPLVRYFYADYWLKKE